MTGDNTTIRAATEAEALDLSVPTIVAYFSGGKYAAAIVALFAHALLAVCRLTLIRASILAGQVANETGRFTFTGAVKPEQYNLAGLAATDDGAAGLSFDGIGEGVSAVAAHHGGYLFGPAERWPAAWRELLPLAVRLRVVVAAGYGGTVTTLGDYGAGRWATDKDYAAKVARHANALLDLEGTQGGAMEPTKGHVPKPPLVVRPVVPPKSSGKGYDLSATPRQPLGTCTHSMVGTLWGTDGHFRLPNTAGLTDYGVGQKDMGQGYAEIIQWCDPHGKVIPWANGEATGIEGDGRRFVDTHGVGQINRGLVSIETEDGAIPTDAQGRPTAPATAAQWSSLVWLTAYIHAEWCGQTAATLDWHLLHKEFATKDCPFPRIYSHLGELRAAVRAVMRHWQEGAAYPAGGVVINGRRLTVPTRPVAAIESPFIRALRALWAA